MKRLNWLPLDLHSGPPHHLSPAAIDPSYRVSYCIGRDTPSCPSSHSSLKTKCLEFTSALIHNFNYECPELSGMDPNLLQCVGLNNGPLLAVVCRPK